jgi:hypothetical protein
MHIFCAAPDELSALQAQIESPEKTVPMEVKNGTAAVPQS